MSKYIVQFIKTGADFKLTRGFQKTKKDFAKSTNLAEITKKHKEELTAIYDEFQKIVEQRREMSIAMLDYLNEEQQKKLVNFASHLKNIIKKIKFPNFS